MMTREEFVAAAVAAAPEMTDAQAERIAGILRGSPEPVTS